MFMYSVSMSIQYLDLVVRAVVPSAHTWSTVPLQPFNSTHSHIGIVLDTRVENAQGDARLICIMLPCRHERAQPAGGRSAYWRARAVGRA